MIQTGSSQHWPDIKIIFSHAGGTMPFLIDRLERVFKNPGFAAKVPKGFLAEARRFWYDTAQTAHPASMYALRQVAPVSHIVFGTDYPFGDAVYDVKGLRNSGVFSAQELAAIDRGNIARILPRYRA
jgi:predicted TIM-barrel fold metal-dependent hydrolase